MIKTAGKEERANNMQTSLLYYFDFTEQAYEWYYF